MNDPLKIFSGESTSNRSKRIILVDDHPMIRQGLRYLLESEMGFEVCGEAKDIKSAITVAKEKCPDLAIVDICLKGADGLELAERLKQQDKKLRILAYSMYDEVLYAERALNAGAGGYVMKNESSETILYAIDQVLKDQVYVSPRMANRIMQKFSC